jgi:HEPN domain-containing protein
VVRRSDGLHIAVALQRRDASPCQGEAGAQRRVRVDHAVHVGATRCVARKATLARTNVSVMRAAMARRAKDWWRQAEVDLAFSRHALAGGYYDWACFAAQQAAEKGLKAVYEHIGNEAWGHSVTQLLEGLSDFVEADEAQLDRARQLDKLYITTRYPNGLPAGAPADFFTREEAERAIAHAEAILEFCRGALSR